MFLHPLGLLSLVAIPAIVVLHLFRRRFRPRRVSALFLWADDDETMVSGRKRERLRTSASFWLELLAALLIGLAFAGPIGCGTGEAQHLICILDASASMGAEIGDERIQQSAVEVARARIDALPARSKVTLIQSGARPTLLAGPAAFTQEALEALDDYSPGAARHDLGPAIALGQQLSGGGAVLVVTDRLGTGQFPADVEIVAVGRASGNVAITHATRARASDSDDDRVMVSLTALTNGPVSTVLSISVDGQVFDRRDVQLEPDTRRHFVFDVPEGTGPIELALPPDALGIDNQAFLAPTPPRTILLASTLTPTDAVALGISTGESQSALDNLLALVPHSSEATSPELAHVVFGNDLDATTLSQRTWSFSIDGVHPASAPTDLIGPFLAEFGHPLLDGLTLEGIVWSIDPEQTLRGTPLVSAGDRPLLTEETAGGPGSRRAFRMNIDPFRSSLQRSPDWPILLANVVAMRRAELPGAVRANVVVGEAFEFRSGAQSRERTYEVRRVSGASQSGADDEVWRLRAHDVLAVDDIDRPGLYAVSRDGTEVCRFGVSFKDARESDLRGSASGTHRTEADLAGTASVMGPLETGLLLAALLALLADWWVLHGTRRASIGVAL